MFRNKKRLIRNRKMRSKATRKIRRRARMKRPTSQISLSKRVTS
jgi:hypothetical protein